MICLCQGVLFDTATGRVLLAFLPEAERHAILREHGYVAEKAREWEDILARIRANREARLVKGDLCAFAVPIFRQGNCWAALGGFLPKLRLRATTPKRLCAILRQAASVLERRLAKIDEKIALAKGDNHADRNGRT